MASPLFVAEGAEQRQCLAFARFGADGITRLEARQCQRRQRRGHFDLVAKPPIQHEAGLQHPPRLAVVALASGQGRADIGCVRLGQIRRLHRRQRERGAHDTAPLRQVAAQHPERRHRHRQLHRDDRIGAAGQRQRDRGAQVV